MSDDTLSQLVTEAIAHNLSPLLKWMYGTFGAVILGTAFVVGMVYDVRYGIIEAKHNASEAQATADKAMQSTVDLRATVIGHDRDIAILKVRSGGE